ncbi:MAG: iron-containing alcohol dehydrogenase, partial [Planctomycetaceae bacterium]|nr:iron-containing alcohol dehydrogenase [Planctomycetaceae bacterium]
SKILVPDVALVDPVTTTTMDPQLTALTGMDAVTHLVEAFVSTASSPLTDVNALAAIPLILKYLPQAVRHPEAMEFRTPMMMASLMAGLAFSNAGLGATHSLSHALGGLLDLPHGECNMWFLNEVIDFNFSSAAEKYRRLGEGMGLDLAGATPERCKSLLLERLASLEKEIGAERGAQDIAISADLIPRLAATAAADVSMLTNPRTPTLEDVQVLYERALLR